jgi:ribosomal protein L40E
MAGGGAVAGVAVSGTASGTSCRFCGSPMPAGAVRCNECELRQDCAKPCIQCGALLPDSARYCPGCESYQADNRECVSCGAYISKQAKVCPKCSSLQAFGGYLNVSHLTITLVIALLSVLGTVVPVIKTALTPDQSQTHLQVIEMRAPMPPKVDEYQLLLLATNSGNRPSYLHRIKLEFKQFPKADRSMNIVSTPEDRLLNPHSQKLLWLQVDLRRSELKFKDDAEFRDKYLGGGHVLKAEVIGTGESTQPIEIEADSELLKNFVYERTSV